MSDALVMRSVARNTATMSGRCIRLSRRQIDAVITSIMLPVMLLLMFVYLFGGAIDTGGHYLDYVIPGLSLLCAGFGAASTAMTVSQDLTGGIVDRLRSLDVSGPAVLGGHVVASVVRNAVATSCVALLAFAIGYRTDAPVTHLLLAGGLVALFVLAISWVAADIGLLAPSPESANAFTFVFMFLPYASSAFVPIATMPTWIQPFARNEPITPITETIRGLLNGTPMGSSPVQALAWCVGLLVVAVAASGPLFRRRTR